LGEQTKVVLAFFVQCMLEKVDRSSAAKLNKKTRKPYRVFRLIHAPTNV